LSVLHSAISPPAVSTGARSAERRDLFSTTSGLSWREGLSTRRGACLEASEGALVETTGSSQFLGHEDPAGARRVARDLAEHPPAILLVELRRLETDGVEHRPLAAALATLRLGHRQQPLAYPAAAQGLGKVDEIEEQQAERGPPADTAQRVAVGVPDQHGKRLVVVDAGLLVVVDGQSPPDHLDIAPIGRIGNDDGRFGHHRSCRSSSRMVRPRYSLRTRPRRCSSGTTRSTNSSIAPGQ